MSHVREYIGCKSIEAADYDGDGHNLYSMWLTDTEIIRCRDCGRYHDGSSQCTRFVWGEYDEQTGAEVLTFLDVQPTDYCSWAKRREL